MKSLCNQLLIRFIRQVVVVINVQNLSQTANFTNMNVCYARLYRIKEDDYTEPVPLCLYSAAPNFYIPVTADPPAAAATSGETSRKRLRQDGVYS